MLKLMTRVGMLIAVFVASVHVAAAQTPTYPSGQTIFAADVPAVGPVVASHFQLQLDGQDQPLVPAGSFITGTFEWPQLLISVGVHTIRARACKDWGVDLGGQLCSDWQGFTFQAVASGAPGALDNFRIRRVVIEVGQP